MKLARFTHVIVVAAIIVAAGAGCRKGPGYLTPLPNSKKTTIQDPGSTPPLIGMQGQESPISSDAIKNEGIPMADPSAYDTWNQNADIFKENTVYFAFDSSAVSAGEKAKVTAVAEYLKSNTTPRTAVRVEGHCDERGTEEYNRSLGERRAVAIREELVAQGIDPSRVVTVTFGEDRPAVQGHDDSAWRQNRRGEFILLTEP